MYQNYISRFCTLGLKKCRYSTLKCKENRFAEYVIETKTPPRWKCQLKVTHWSSVNEKTLTPGCSSKYSCLFDDSSICFLCLYFLILWLYIFNFWQYRYLGICFCCHGSHIMIGCLHFLSNINHRTHIIWIRNNNKK